YAWVKISGPAAGTLTNANTSTSTAGSLVQGVYSYELTVTDNGGATTRDTVLVGVNIAAANRAPTAIAGNDLSIYLPEDSVNLLGSGIDPDGFIAGYSWKIIGFTGAYLFSNASSSQTTVRHLQQGIYTIELTVTDNLGAIGRDTVLVNVGASRLQNVLEEVNIYPNPVTDIFKVKIASPKSDQAIMLIIYDSKGAKVYQKLITLIGNIKIETIDISTLRSGTYFLEINYYNGNKIVKKIVKV
ncbi:MAG: T9SS type A sorting domain-containing protein, partial [Ferruginibacter sp.]